MEKQKISTSGKMLDMTDRIRPEVQELMQGTLALMKEGKHIPQECVSLGPDDLSLDTEELSASPLLCLKLRWVIADMLFGSRADRDPVPESTMEKIIDADPFLGAHSEFKKANAVKHIDDVKQGREQWIAVKTVGALVFNLQYTEVGIVFFPTTTVTNKQRSPIIMALIGLILNFHSRLRPTQAA